MSAGHDLGSPTAWVVAAYGTETERVVAVPNRLHIGREPAGAESQQLRLTDPSVSRQHAEIYVDTSRGVATVIDTSTNGTRLNGIRIERAVAVPLGDGDVLRVGDTDLLFRTTLRPLPVAAAGDGRQTITRVAPITMALVVGDVVGYSTVAQGTPSVVLVDAIGRLFGALRILLRRHRGTLADMPGDAFFSFWDLDASVTGAHDAMSFALDASEEIERLAPGLALRTPEGTPLAMGWAVVVGEVAVSPLGAAILGDATNLAFRLSGLAGREGRPRILATVSTRDAIAAEEAFIMGTAFETPIKGRAGLETVFGVTRSDLSGG